MKKREIRETPEYEILTTPVKDSDKDDDRDRTNWNEDKTLDEAVFARPEYFHLEQMSDGHWWMGVKDRLGDTWAINLFTKRGSKIHAKLELDQ
jgi:hypothetical protein